MHLSQARHETPLATVASSAMLTYQSRATQPFSEEALHLLLQTAQARDEASDVTSLLIYRKGRYFHCLEGPTLAVKALWSAIQRGPRHTDVHLPGTAPITNRFFSNWDMRLVQPDIAANSIYTDSMYVAPAVDKVLYRALKAAPSSTLGLARDAIWRAAPAGPDHQRRDIVASRMEHASRIPGDRCGTTTAGS